MVRLILTRHGETSWNAKRRYQGQTDVPLSDVGRRQAAALSRRLALREIHAIYVSDLQRAFETAQIIAEPHGLSPVVAPCLREISFGDWEGLTYDEVQARDPENLAAWLSTPVDVAPAHGETMSQVAERVKPLLDTLVRDHQGQTVLWVTHGGLLRILLCLLLELPLRSHWKLRMDNTALSELEIYDNGAILNYMNDCHHLDHIGEHIT